MKRAEHLPRVRIPMLFLQGTRDELADLALLRPIVDATAQDRIRERILDAFAQYEQETAGAL